MPSTVGPLEVLWTITTMIGTLIAGWNWWDAQGDLDALRASKLNGILMITAKGARSDQQMVFVALLTDTAAGMLAMFSLPGRDAEGDVSLAALFLPWLLIIGALALIFLSLSQKRRRKSILEALRARHS